MPSHRDTAIMSMHDKIQHFREARGTAINSAIEAVLPALCRLRLVRSASHTTTTLPLTQSKHRVGVPSDEMSDS
jgi:hypothetical protein